MPASPEAEEILGKKEDLPVQYSFIVLPPFKSLQLIEGTKAKLSRSREVIRKKPPKGTAISISGLEVVIPYLMKATGELKTPLELWHPNETSEIASRVGTELHIADAMFTALAKGRGGLRIPTVFPTAKDEVIARLKKATSGISVLDTEDQTEIENRLISAWETYAETETQPSADAEPTSFNFLPPIKKLELALHEELYEQVRASIVKLARWWAREVCNPDPMTWEFLPTAYTYREFFVPLSFRDINLQIRGRLDSISRFRKEGDLVQGQLIDLKTGRRRDVGGLAGFIRKRQSQMMWIMAERFVAMYFMGEEFFEQVERMETRDEAFHLTSFQNDEVFSDRLSLVAYRWFNQDTGEMELEKVTMTDKDREEFHDWLNKFGALVNRHKKDVRGILDKKIQFKVPTDEESTPT